MRYALPLLLLLSTAAGFAQTDSMFVEQKDGSVRAYAVREIVQIAFSNSPGQRVSAADEQMMQQVLTTFAVSQNYPNPFNPTTRIQYTIPQTGDVVINVFDMQGRLVRALDAGIRQAGSNAVVWDARDDAGAQVSSGVYYCQVLFNKNSIVKKLLFLK